MNVLLIGGGGREHAIAMSLAKSPLIKKLYCAPGNAGIAGICETVPVSATDTAALLETALRLDIDYTVVGMDDTLALGITDLFQENGLKIFGPNKRAAKIEWSKAYAKDFMRKYGIPTADYERFDDYGKALTYINKKEPPYVIKADGLALGKGVLICRTQDEAEEAVSEMILEKRFGGAGENIVIEEFLEGRELTILAFCDGETIAPMVSSHDYKRAFDGDIGPNTGGMGAVSPSPRYTLDVEQEFRQRILAPTLNAFKAEGIEYCGVIYFELIVTKSGLKVIEYNARFGDPEAQVVLPRLETDFMEIAVACIEKKLATLEIKWKEDAAVCVVAASGGYPGDYKKGFEISGLDLLDNRIMAFHAGTAKLGQKLVTNGGRVLGITAFGETVEAAADKAYHNIKKISFDEMRFRSDIAK